MLKIWKYLLFNIVFTTFVLGDILTWGGYSKLDITKTKVDAIIKAHVDTKYPDKVKEYNQKLADMKQSKIDAVSDSTFIHGKLMWQDTSENTTLMLNQLESKIYCKGINLAKRKDWRVPTYLELLELVDYTKSNPASLEKIKYITPESYWSDTQKLDKKESRIKSFWYVDYLQGMSDIGSEMDKRNVRCVRELSPKKDDY